MVMGMGAMGTMGTMEFRRGLGELGLLFVLLLRRDERREYGVLRQRLVPHWFPYRPAPAISAQLVPFRPVSSRFASCGLVSRRVVSFRPEYDSCGPSSNWRV